MKKANSIKEGWRNEFVKVVAPLPVAAATDTTAEDKGVVSGIVNDGNDVDVDVDAGDVAEEEKELIIEDLNEETEKGEGEEVGISTVEGEQMVEQSESTSSNNVGDFKEGHVTMTEQVNQKEESFVAASKTTSASAAKAAPASAASLFTSVAAPVAPPIGNVAPVPTVDQKNTAMEFFGPPVSAPEPTNISIASTVTPPVVTAANTTTSATTVEENTTASSFLPPVHANVLKSEDQQQQQPPASVPSVAPMQKPPPVGAPTPPTSSSAPKFKVPEQHNYNQEEKQKLTASTTITPSISQTVSLAAGDRVAPPLFSNPNASTMSIGTPIVSNKQPNSSTSQITAASADGASSATRSSTAQPTSKQTAGFKIPKFNKPHHPSPRITRRPPPSTLLSSTPDRLKNLSTPPINSSIAGSNMNSNTNSSVAIDVIKRTKAGLSLPTPSTGISRTRQFGAGGRVGCYAGLGNRSSGSSVGSGGGGSLGLGPVGSVGLGGRFRMPPPVTIASSPNVRRRNIGGGTTLSVTSTPGAVSGGTRNLTFSGAPSSEGAIVSPLKSPRDANDLADNSSGSNPINAVNESDNLNAVGHLSTELNDVHKNIETQVEIEDKGAAGHVPQKITSSAEPVSLASEGPSKSIVPEVFAEIQSAATEKSSNVTLLKLEDDEEEVEKEGDGNEESTEKNEVSAQTISPPSLVGSESQLPEGWIELVVPDTGKKYYLNIESRVTQWERPIQQEASSHPTSQPQTSQNLEDNLTETDKDPSTPEENEIKDIGNDSIEKVGDTQVSNQFDNVDDDGAKDSSETNIGLVDTADGSNDVNDKAPEMTPDSNGNFEDQVFESETISRSISDDYVHVKNGENDSAIESSEYPPTDDILNKPEYQPSDSQSSTSALKTVERVSSVRSSDSNSNYLALGWVELFDESTGAPYYFNEEEGVTSWERPVAVTEEVETKDSSLIVDSPDPVMQSVGETTEASSPEKTEPYDSLDHPIALDSDLPEPSSPEDAYPTKEDVNSTINNPVSSAPKEAELVPENETSVNESDAPILTLGWVESTDPATKRLYYYNETTGETSWEKPVEEICHDITEGGSNVELLNIQGGEEKVESEGFDSSSKIDTIEPEETEIETDAILEDAPLQPGWIKLIDESSGLPYYFNQSEGITTWEIPLSSDIKHEDEYGTETNSLEDNVNDTKEAEEPNENQVFLSPSEAASVFNTAEENSFDDQNREDSAPFETSPEPNIEETEETEVIKEIEEEADESTPTDDLPIGWVELIDESSGLPYYYHETEDVTTWEKPQQSQSAESEHQTETETDEKKDAAVDNDAGADEKDVQADGDLQNEVNGTPEATFIEPISSKEPTSDQSSSASLHQELAHHTSAEVKEVGDDFGAIQDTEKEMDRIIPTNDLPSGWSELIDESSGLPYYYNETENITTWDKPQHVLSGTEIEQQNDKEEEKKNGDSVVKESDTGEQGVQADGSIQHGDVGETKLDVAPVEVPLSEEKVCDDFNEEMVHDDAKTLPTGWVEKMDTSSGLTYYYNEIENITTWDKPINETENDDYKTEGQIEESAEISSFQSADEIDHSPQEDLTTLEVDKQENSIRSDTDDNKVPSEASDLPQGWVELIDENSGLPYYFNETENITRWDKPVTVTSESQEEPSDIVVSNKSRESSLDKETTEEVENKTQNIGRDEALDLPPGWVQEVDPSSGKPYYYNEVEKITTWERPSVSEKLNDGLGEHSENEPTIDEPSTVSIGIQDEWVDVDSLPTTENNSAAATLPKGWVQLTDETSGKTYYYHKEDNVTTWDRPKMTAPSLQSNVENSHTDTNRCSNNRLRPAHAIATFGFGGRLCVMIPQVAENLSSVPGLNINNENNITTMRKGPVEIHRTSSLISSEHLPVSSGNTSSNYSSLGPLNSSNDNDVLLHLESKSGVGEKDSQLLWNLIHIAARWKGRLRSVEGISDPNGPEAAIVNLLLQDQSEHSEANSMVSLVNGRSLLSNLMI